MRFLLIINLLLFACDIRPVQLACEQQQHCLSGPEQCKDCEASNFIDVCIATRDYEVYPASTCPNSNCQEAVRLYEDYLTCISLVDCEQWEEAAELFITLCRPEHDQYVEAKSNCASEQYFDEPQEGISKCLL